jgi:5'-nucleotidase
VSVVPDRPVALIDMDGTLCDCAGAIAEALAPLRSPGENGERERDDLAPHIVARRRLIMSVPGFWKNLQPLSIGFQIIDLLRGLRFDLHILTKGPAEQSAAWSEKVEWCRRHVPDIPVIIADRKSVVRGDVLVEDWPPYIEEWLATNPSGVVIVPAQPWNVRLAPSVAANALRCDGDNLGDVRRRLEALGSSPHAARGAPS